MKKLNKRQSERVGLTPYEEGIVATLFDGGPTQAGVGIAQQ